MLLPPSSSAAPNAQAAALLTNLEFWQDHPADFVRENIGAEPDPWQVDAMHDLLTYGRVSISACHGPGKDALAAWVVLWVLLCFLHPKGLCTAPTAAQLHDLLWAEVAKWHMQMPPYFRDQLEITKGRIFLKGHKETWFATARTARPEKPEALAGIHADTVLVIADEASGVANACFEVTEGALTGPRWFCLLIGNPTQSSGYFFDSHHSDRDRWRCYRVMAESAHDGTPLAPGVYTSKRVSPEYVRAIAKKYGITSNVYRVRVLGLFPMSEDDQVILYEWLEAARAREMPEGHVPKGFAVVGLDVARFGSDDSAMVTRQGPDITHLDDWHGHNEASTAGKVLSHCRRLIKAGTKVKYVFVDAAGVGANVVKILRANTWFAENGIFIVAVQVGGGSPDRECDLLRDALWWRGRKVFNPDGGGDRLKALPRFMPGLDPEKVARLTGELSQPKFTFDTTQKIKVESKDEMRERQVGSPDMADAFLLTLYMEAGMPEPKPEEKRREQTKPASRFGR